MTCVEGGGEKLGYSDLWMNTGKPDKKKHAGKPRERGTYSVMTLVTDSGTKQNSKHAKQWGAVICVERWEEMRRKI